MKIRKVKRDPDDMTLAIGSSILPGLNADSTTIGVRVNLSNCGKLLYVLTTAAAGDRLCSTTRNGVGIVKMYGLEQSATKHLSEMKAQRLSKPHHMMEGSRVGEIRNGRHCLAVKI